MFSSLLGLNTARALFLSSSTRKYFCKRQTATKTGKPLSQTFDIQLRDKFSLAWDDSNQFRDCPAQLQQLVIGCMTHTAPSDRLLLFGAGYKYSLLTYLPYRVLEYSIRLSTEYSCSKNLDSPNPIRWSPHLGCLLLVCRCARCARCEGCARCRG